MSVLWHVSGVPGQGADCVPHIKLISGTLTDQAPSPSNYDVISDIINTVKLTTAVPSSFENVITYLLIDVNDGSC